MNAHRICTTCTGTVPGEPIRCESLDCQWLYSRKRAESKREFLAVVEELLDDLDNGVKLLEPEHRISVIDVDNDVEYIS